MKIQSPDGRRWDVRRQWAPRLLFRRPWTVEAVAEDDGTELHFQAVGLGASRRLRDDVAGRLSHGHLPEDARRV